MSTIPMFDPKIFYDALPKRRAELIGGGGELKFEWFDGKAVFGGSEETTHPKVQNARHH